MRLIGVLALVLLTRTPALAAQDTLNDPLRTERLRQMIEERFGQRLKEELGLTPDQEGRLKAALAGFASRRRGMEQDERTMRQALAGQLRPGIAANTDSVARLVDALTNHRVEYAQTFKDEMRDLSAILNPVQRGQYLLLRDRLMLRAAQVQQGRGDPALVPRGARRRP